MLRSKTAMAGLSGASASLDSYSLATPLSADSHLRKTQPLATSSHEVQSKSPVWPRTDLA